MTILEFFFASASHYIQLLILVILICPWHWTMTRKHKIEFGPEKKSGGKNESNQNQFKAHSD